MIKNIVEANGKRYTSEIKEFKEGLPHGILNKVLTDVGGTMAALKAKCNYIIVCPFTGLVDSIMDDKNSPYKVFGKYKGTGSVSEFKDYINSTPFIKIAVTYDSFPIIIDMIERYSDITTYKLLIDEYHLILSDIGFRERAINDLMINIKKFSHYTFMSATPMQEQFIPKFMSYLPYTEINWDIKKMFFPKRLRTYNVYRTTTKLISEFLGSGLFLDINGKEVKVEELYIYLNSVTGIKQICDTLKLKEDLVKIVCSERVKNSAILDNYKINKITESNKPINFFTKKGFQGCNLFTNNGLVIVISDANKSQTLVDIETVMFQINGRIRTNKEFNNVFKDRIWHIYSLNNNSKKKEINNDDELEVEIKSLKEETLELINLYNTANEAGKKLLLKRINIEDLICCIEDGQFFYSDLKEQYLRFINHLKNNIYKNGLALKKEYERLGIDPGEEIDVTVDKDEIILAKLNTVSFKDLLKQYIELREEKNSKYEFIRTYEEENILFKEAYEKLGTKKLIALDYSESKIKKAIEDLDLNNIAFKRVFKKLDNGFISSKDLKKLIGDIYKELNINKSPKATDIEDCYLFQVKKVNK